MVGGFASLIGWRRRGGVRLSTDWRVLSAVHGGEILSPCGTEREQDVGELLVRLSFPRFLSLLFVVTHPPIFTRSFDSSVSITHCPLLSFPLYPTSRDEPRLSADGRLRWVADVGSGRINIIPNPKRNLNLAVTRAGNRDGSEMGVGMEMDMKTKSERQG